LIARGGGAWSLDRLLGVERDPAPSGAGATTGPRERIA
jgi:hypothetical protein